MFAGNTFAVAEEERVNDPKFVVETFFNQLPMRTGLLPKNILFIIDGIHPHLYSEQDLQKAKGSYFFLMRDFFMNYADLKGYEVIDMQPIFIAHYEQNGVKFEFKNDGHWNELGHRIVARSINTSILISHLGCT